MNIIAMVLAVYRLTSLTVKDELTAPLRDKAQEMALGRPYGSLRERAAYLVSCHRCVSVWAAGAILLASRFTVGRVPISVLALSQSQIALRGLAGRVVEDE